MVFITVFKKRLLNVVKAMYSCIANCCIFFIILATSGKIELMGRNDNKRPVMKLVII